MAMGIVWSTLHLGKFADFDTDESTSTIESGILGSAKVGSQADPLSDHVTDVTTNSSNDNVVSSNNSSTTDTLGYDLGAGPVTAKIDSLPLMKGVVTFADGTTLAVNDLSVFQDTTGNVFLAVRDDQPALVAKPIQSIQFTGVASSNYSGLIQTTRDDLEFMSTAGAPVCFRAGARILTPEGERPVETLREGDLVLTQDHGAQPVRLVQRSLRRFARPGDWHRPILFRAGCLGPGVPSRELAVSPQHRMLLNWPEVRMLHGADEVLAPAKGLLELQGVRVGRGVREVAYIHLLFDRHEIVFANGAPSESFYPGPTALCTIDPADRDAVFTANPRLRAGAEVALGGTARPVLQVQAVRKLVLARGRNMRREIASYDADLELERSAAEGPGNSRSAQSGGGCPGWTRAPAA